MFWKKKEKSIHEKYEIAQKEIKSMEGYFSNPEDCFDIFLFGSDGYVATFKAYIKEPVLWHKGKLYGLYDFWGEERMKAFVEIKDYDHDYQILNDNFDKED